MRSVCELNYKGYMCEDTLKIKGTSFRESDKSASKRRRVLVIFARVVDISVIFPIKSCFLYYRTFRPRICHFGNICFSRQKSVTD